MKTLNQKNRQEASKWLTLLLKVHTKNGWPMTQEVAFHFAALAAWCGCGITDSEIMQVLQGMISGSESGLERFEELLLKHVSDLEAAQKNSKVLWTFLVPFQMGFKDFTPKSLRLFGQTFHFWDATKVVRRIGKTRISRYMDSRLAAMTIEQPYQTFIMIRSRGDNEAQAWNAASRAFDALLGFLEFNFSLGTQRFHLSLQVGQPDSHFPPPRWLINATPGQSILLLWFPIEGEYPEKRTEPITEKKWKSLLDKAKGFQEMPDNKHIRSVITDGFRLYAQALYARLPYARLLGFWQLAETLTLSENFGGKTEIICNRLVAFPPIWNIDGEAFRFALNGIAEKRNEVVHRGNRAVVQDRDVHTIKLAVESVLYRLLYLGRHLRKLDALEQFYRHHDRPEHQLNPLHVALRFMKWLDREKKKKPNS